MALCSSKLDRYETVNTRSKHNSPRVAGSIPTGGKLFAEFMKDPARIWQNMTNYRKTRIPFRINLFYCTCDHLLLCLFSCERNFWNHTTCGHKA